MGRFVSHMSGFADHSVVPTWFSWRARGAKMLQHRLLSCDGHFILPLLRVARASAHPAHPSRAAPTQPVARKVLDSPKRWKLAHGPMHSCENSATKAEAGPTSGPTWRVFHLRYFHRPREPTLHRRDVEPLSGSEVHLGSAGSGVRRVKTMIK